MKIKRFLSVVTWITLCTLLASLLSLAGCQSGPGSSTCPANAVDLAKIDRTVRKEPIYQSKSPKYCLLVFGPKAATRIWLVLDLVSEPWEANGAKNALYVDRNGNGDLTEPGARVTCTMREQEHHVSFSPKPSVTCNPHFKVADIVERDGTTRHAELTLDVGSYVQDYRPCSVSLIRLPANATIAAIRHLLYHEQSHWTNCPRTWCERAGRACPRLAAQRTWSGSC